MPLPGVASHYKMMPPIREKIINKEEIKAKKPKMAAVTVLFYPDEKEQTRLLLILRKTYKGVHSNQIAFPGGKVEAADKDLHATALRETYEEVGVLPENINILKTLTEVYIPPSNFLVQPFMGLYKKKVPYILQESEVETIVEVLLSDFMDDKNVQTEKITTTYVQNMETPIFKFNGYTVWGATAMMLNEVKELLKLVLY